MNRTFLKALSVAFGVASASLSMAQGWPAFCDDPTTTDSIYSDDYGGNGVGNDLFNATMAASGSVTYELCFANPFDAEAAGGIHFGTGPVASVQTNADDYLALQFGGGFVDFIDPVTGQRFFTAAGARANWTYAALFTTAEDGTGETRTKFGTVAIDTFFDGASDRYLRAESTMDGVRVQLRIDSIGDAARLQWTLTNNNAEARQLGLWFGQYMDPIGNYNLQPRGITYVGVPGHKPLTVGRRFATSPNPDPNLEPREHPMPPFVDFGATQARMWEGMRIINRPTSGSIGAFPDQTPVDGLDIDNPGFLLGPGAGNDAVFPDGVFEDITFGAASYIQKWNPRPVLGNAATIAERRVQIVSYYKTTWGDSDFAKPYGVVADSPKVIGVQDANPFNYVRSPATLRVYLDNIRGFTTVDQMISIANAKITLTLPQGLADASDPSRRVITRTMGAIPPKQIRFIDFQIQALDTTFGVLEYQVKVEPQPGPVKIVSGNITVASQPYLQITQNANLVTAPWQFTGNSWATVLGNGPEPLVPDVDYQAIAWDAATQQYLLQTGPQRGIGTWIISNKNVGFKALGGNPQTPQDLATGSPLVDLYYGWNLIANPFNYPIQVGQLVGVPGSNQSQAFTYQQLVDQNVISGSLAYWDRGTQSYKFIGEVQDYLMPNQGYWINVVDPLGLTLSYPPVFTPFIPQGTGGIQAAERKDYLWQTNIVVSNGARLDRVNTFGFAAPHVDNVRSTLVYEPPITPEKVGVSSYFVTGPKTSRSRLARQLTRGSETSSFNLQVFNARKGDVTVKWPEISAVPEKYEVILVDSVTGAKVNMRTTPTYTFNTPARQARDLRIIVREKNVPLMGTVSAQRTGAGANDPIAISYTLNAPVQATVNILRSGKLVKTIVENSDQAAGGQRLLWNLLKADGTRVQPGTFQAEVKVTDGDKTESQTVSFYVR